MVIVPFVFALVSIGHASRVAGGLRGATELPEMKRGVGLALGGSSLTAIFAPPGAILGVLSALALTEERRRRARGQAEDRR